MFQFRRVPAYTYLIQCTLHGYCPCGFPHSEIPGSKSVCDSPRLIAASHVRLRLLVPRHSPCALISLTSSEHALYPSLRCSSMVKGASEQVCLLCCSAGSQELCRPQIWFIVVCVTLYYKVHKKLCYLSVACSQFLACFTVQFSRCRSLTLLKVRLKCSLC